MNVTPAAQHHVTIVEDSRRWEHVALRPDDIVIATPPKSGTTWTQGIVRSLQWPRGDAPADRGPLSVWPDLRSTPLEEMLVKVEALPGRRQLKAHLPATALPWSESIRYIAVFRNPGDTLASWSNHRAAMFPDRVAMLNDAAEDDLPPLREAYDGEDYEYLFEEWTRYWSPFEYLAGWWPRRVDNNVLLVHYADLYANLEAGMRRLADFLEFEVPEECWRDMVERCSLDSMREAARVSAPGLNISFQHGADSFFYKGGLGRGAELLPTHITARIEQEYETLEPEAAAWLNLGSASGVSPDQL